MDVGKTMEFSVHWQTREEYGRIPVASSDYGEAQAYADELNKAMPRGDSGRKGMFWWIAAEEDEDEE